MCVCVNYTVRNLQARVLREEWEKREQLEKLQQEQQELLEMEQMRRLEFEQMQQKNEQQLQGTLNIVRKLNLVDMSLSKIF